MAMRWSNRIRLGATALAGIAAAALPACKNGGDSTGPTAPSGVAACSGTQVLTVSPVVLGVLQAIVPLGNLNPSGHVFPTDHVYLYTPFVRRWVQSVVRHRRLHIPAVLQGHIYQAGGRSDDWYDGRTQ
jgi:hypothetical protein